MNLNHPTLALCRDLIRRRSVTPNDEGCQELIGHRLARLGFKLETLVFEDTTNLWARRGDTGPVFCFAGHTDVVPPGPEHTWNTPPFEPTDIDGYIYGRGAADMKGSLAAMLVAVESFVEQNPNHEGSLAFLITSDEEGPFINGTTRVIDTLEARNEKIDWCIVGEPSSTKTCGDVVKYGRRGSLSGALTVHGVQGHVAYPHLAENPIHAAAPALAHLAKELWDRGNHAFPPTSFQVSDIQGGTGAGNVIPGELHVQFNLRFSTESTAESLMQRIDQILNQYELQFSIDWKLNGQPFLTDHGQLLSAARESIKEISQIATELSTSGGTSDGRFIAPTGAQVIELGPVNATIHKANERVSHSDLIVLTEYYQSILKTLLGNQ